MIELRIALCQLLLNIIYHPKMLILCIDLSQIFQYDNDNIYIYIYIPIYMYLPLAVIP